MTDFVGAHQPSVNVTMIIESPDSFGAPTVPKKVLKQIRKSSQFGEKIKFLCSHLDPEGSLFVIADSLGRVGKV